MNMHMHIHMHMHMHMQTCTRLEDGCAHVLHLTHPTLGDSPRIRMHVVLQLPSYTYRPTLTIRMHVVRMSMFPCPCVHVVRVCTCACLAHTNEHELQSTYRPTLTIVHLPSYTYHPTFTIRTPRTLSCKALTIVHLPSYTYHRTPTIVHLPSYTHAHLTPMLILHE